VNVTVIVCTYNRCQSLAQALGSVASSFLPGSVGWEVLVVDNNSRDRTRAVVEEISCRYPGRFRYLFEAQSGKSCALNSAIREALGDILAFVDDDVTVEPTWLQNLTAELHDNQWGGAGGRIRPQGPFSPPPWLITHGPPIPGQDIIDFESVGPLVLFDLGDKAGELDRPPYGTNMAFRKAMFERYGGFRTDLGPRPGSQIRNEETEFCLRLIAGGERLRYEPSAVVYHPVPKNRLTKSFLRAWWFAYGRAVIRQTGQQPSVLGIPSRYRQRFRNRLHWMFTCNPHWPLYPQWRFYWETQLCIAAGEIVETLKSKFNLPRDLIGGCAQRRTGKLTGPSDPRRSRNEM
jgi:glycosyltransferase involved in cell wall biosynthesis